MILISYVGIGVEVRAEHGRGGTLATNVRNTWRIITRRMDSRAAIVMRRWTWVTFALCLILAEAVILRMES